jgi:hypothetical protein
MNSEQVLSMLKTNVNEHTEKKNGLTYLSWAWAWAEALKADPEATYKIEMFGDKCYMDINGTAMVFVTVTLFGKPMMCQLPVMDSYNKSITIEGVTTTNKYGKEVTTKLDSFNVNTAIMRCMTKALALHGLGMYIYSGEDLPLGENESDEGAPDESRMLDYIAAIEATTTLDELKDIYIRAFADCDGNKAWQTKMIAAKDAKKKELK